jgi:hypothetical protein
VNNYLNNLVARNLNPAPALQPRLRSQFEPAPTGGSLIAPQPLAVAPDHILPGAAAKEIVSEPPPILSHRASRRRFRESNPPAPDDVAPGTAEIENDPPVVRRHARRHHFANHRSIEAASPSLDGDYAGEAALHELAAITAGETSMSFRTAPPLLTIRQPESLLLPKTPASAPASALALATDAARSDISVVGRRGVIVRPLAEVVEPKGPEPMAGSPSRRNDDQGLLPAPAEVADILIRERSTGTDALWPHSQGQRSATSSAIETGQTAPERAPAVVRPQVTPIFEDRGESRVERGDRRQTSVAPAVHVTIGRIEVRAALAPSPSMPKPRAAQPTMSLDDYLRRRGNGGAR